MDQITFKMYASGIIYILTVLAAAAAASIVAPTNKQYMKGLGVLTVIGLYPVWFINMGTFPMLCLINTAISVIVNVIWGGRFEVATRIRLGGFSALNLILAGASVAYIMSLTP